MPSTQEIRSLRYDVDVTGLSQAEAAMNRVAASEARVADGARELAAATDNTSRSTQTVVAQLERAARTSDPLYKAWDRLAKQQVLLERAMAQGLSGSREFGILQTAATKAAMDLAGANDNLTGAFGRLSEAHAASERAGKLNGLQLAELGHIGRSAFDSLAAGASPLRVLQQEGARLGQALSSGEGGLMGGLKALASGALSIINPLTLGAAALAAGAYALNSYQTAQDRLASSLEGNGRRAGMTLNQLTALADASARAGGITQGSARDLASGFAQAGFGADLTGGLTTASRRYGEITGQSTPDAGKALVGIFQDPARGAAELDKTFGFLDAKLQTTIDRLTAQGDIEGARIAEFQAFKLAQDDVTDRTNVFGKALAFAEGAVSSWADKVGHSIATTFGINSDADKLTQDRATLANLQKVDPLGNADYIGQLKTEIASLEQRAFAAAGEAATKAASAKALELSKQVDAAVRAALPDIDRTRGLQDRTILLGRGLSSPEAAGNLGVSQSQLGQAFGNTVVMATNDDPLARMRQDAQLALKSIGDITLAERAATAARQAEVAVLRESGDISRATAAAQIALNEAIARANRDAKEALITAQQNAARVGLTDYQRGRQEILDKYDGPYGLIDKASGSSSELSDALKPVKDDLARASQMIVDALHDVATSIKGAVSPSSGPYGALTLSAFSKTPGAVSSNQQSLLSTLIAAGYPAAGSAGFVGSLTGESGASLNPSALNPTSGAFGILQALGSRKSALLSQPDPYSFGAQANFILSELNGPESKAGAMLRSATTVQAGLNANLAYERPSPGEVASSYGTRLSAGLQLAGGGNDHNTLRISGSGTPIIASQAADYYRRAKTVDLGAFDKAAQTGPIDAATKALTAQNAALDAQASTLGMSTSAIAAAAEKQQLLNSFTSQAVPITDSMRDKIEALAKGYGDAAQRSEDLRKKQQDLVSTLDDFRDGAKGALSSFTTDLLNGKSAADAFSDALTSIRDKLVSRLEDSFVDSLLGKGGTVGTGLLGSLFSGFHFAGGGIMTSGGPIPLHTYSGGGIANTPQVALFGEGRTPEAYVPLPDGRRIPVAMQGANDNGGSVSVTHAPTYNVTPANGVTPTQLASVMDRNNRQFAASIPNIVRDAQRRGK